MVVGLCFTDADVHHADVLELGELRRRCDELACTADTHTQAITTEADEKEAGQMGMGVGKEGRGKGRQRQKGFVFRRQGAGWCGVVPVSVTLSFLLSMLKRGTRTWSNRP